MGKENKNEVLKFVPSTTSPILTFPKGKEKSQNKDPIPAFFKKKSVTTIP